MYRIALGYDLHRMSDCVSGFIMCGGIAIPCDLQIEGAHSDGDVVYHALTDTLLSVVGTDIGIEFPNTDPRYKDKESSYFLNYAFGLMKKKYYLINIDIIVICDVPKISPYTFSIKENITHLLKIPIEDISIRGKTTEQTRPYSIEAYANILFKKIENKERSYV